MREFLAVHDAYNSPKKGSRSGGVEGKEDGEAEVEGDWEAQHGEK